jgi:hypothetical protein
MFECEDRPSYLDILPPKLVLFGGGSGSSGGSGSQAVDYPEYMKTWHNSMLTNVYNLLENSSAPPLTFLYDPKVWFGVPISGSSVYSALALFNAFDPQVMFKELLSDTSAMKYVLSETAITAIKTIAEQLRAELVDPTGANAAVEAMIDAHSAKLMQKINEDLLPKVEIGMRDLNAVVGTSFVIARELAMEDYQHEVADFSAKSRLRMWELRHELYKVVEHAWMEGAVHAAELGLKRTAMSLEKLKIQVTSTAEIANVATVAQSKYGVIQTEEQTRSKTWKLDLYNHMNAAMASISGAHTVTQPQSQGASMFTGALGMGAMGAGVGAYLGAGSTLGGLAGGAEAGGMMGMAGGPAGAILGGLVGAGIGLIGGMFGK